MEGLPKIVEKLLEDPKISIDLQDKKFNTALHYASAEDSYESCKILLSRNASPDIVNDEGETPLHIAARENCIDILNSLIDCKKRKKMESGGEDSKVSLQRYINKPRNDMKTALLLAAEMGHTVVINLLIDAGADIFSQSSNKISLLHLTASFGNVDAVRSLLEKGIPHNVVDIRRRTPLHRAVRHDHMEVVTVLLDSGADIDAEDDEGITPFVLSVKLNYLKMARYLWEKGAKVAVKDFKLKTALHHAVEKKNLNMVKFVVEICKKLVHAKDVTCHTPVHYAARGDSLEILELLKSHSKQLYEKDDTGETALHVAARFGSVKCLRSLVEAVEHETINCHNFDGQTPLHVAIICNQIGTAKGLLRHKAEVDSVDNNNWTPLHYSATHDDAAGVRLLLKHRADIDYQDSWGWTPLMVAAKHGNANTVAVFLAEDAAVGLLNEDGETFFDIAIDSRNDAVCKTVLESDRWNEVMSCIDRHGRRFMAKLVDKAPHLAEIILDRSTVFSEHPPEHPDFSVTFDYQFLEEEPQSRSLMADTCKILTQKRNVLYFAPDLMANFNREKLLAHPLVASLFSTKWDRICKQLYYTSFFLYLVYVISMSTLIIMEGRTYVKVVERRVQNRLNKTRVRSTRSLDDGIGEITAKAPAAQRYGQVLGSLILVFCCFQIVKELLQLIVLRQKYFKSIANYIEVTLYGLSLYYILVFFTATVATRGLSEIGVMCMFLGWTNALLYLQRIALFRLYIVMFLRVSITIVKLLLVFGIVILAFALTFYLLFIRQTSFRSPLSSIARVLVMITGEFDYENTISTNLGVKDSKTGFPFVPFPTLSYNVFIIFIFLGAVAFTNLLVGLAVGDIDEIRKLATVTIYEQQLEFIDSVQGIMPQFLLKKVVYVPSLKYKVNQKTLWQKCKKFVLQDSTDECIKDLYMKHLESDPEHIRAQALEECEKANNQNKRYALLEKLLKEQSSLLKGIVEESKQDSSKC